MTHASNQEWRCTKCGRLLGLHKNKAVHIKHKRAQLVVTGSVMAVCPVCAELNETRSGRPPLPARNPAA